MASPQCAPVRVSSNRQLVRRTCCKHSSCEASHHCESSCDFSDWKSCQNDLSQSLHVCAPKCAECFHPSAFVSAAPTQWKKIENQISDTLCLFIRLEVPEDKTLDELDIKNRLTNSPGWSR